MSVAVEVEDLRGAFPFRSEDCARARVPKEMRDIETRAVYWRSVESRYVEYSE